MKKTIVMAALLVNMVTAVSGTDFEERITEMKCTPIIGHFNKLILRTDS